MTIEERIQEMAEKYHDDPVYIARAFYKMGWEHAAQAGAKAIYWDAIEMTAWMGLREEKRVKYATILGENLLEMKCPLEDK